MCRRLIATFVLAVVAGAATGGFQHGLRALFRAEIELAATKLRMKPADLDPDVAFALAATGVTWRPSAGGVDLIRSERRQVAYAPYAERVRGYTAARNGDPRVRASFALSLLLDSPEDGQGLWKEAYDGLQVHGKDLDSILVGILSAGDRYPLLPRLTYSAADVLVLRIDPAQLPLYLAMASSKDTYLRSRGVAALGILTCSDRSAAQGAIPGLRVALRAYPISASQRAMFCGILEDAARDGSYRVRGAAALGLGLSDHDGARRILQRLARDPAYLLTEGATAGSKRVRFPVRATAEAMLGRLGFPVAGSGGDFSGRALREATRGGRDVTKDRRGMKKEMAETVPFHPWGW